MERNGRSEGGASSAHIKHTRKGKDVRVCQSHSPATKIDAAVCAVSTEIRIGKQGQEDKRDRRYLEKPEGRRQGEEKKPTAGGNKILSKPVGSTVVFLQEKKSSGGLPFYPSVNEKYFYPHKRKG